MGCIMTDIAPARSRFDYAGLARPNLPAAGAPASVPPLISVVTAEPRPDDAELLHSSNGRAEWIAAELVKAGAVFDGKVHVPQAKKLAKKAGAVEPITLSALKAIVSITLREMPRVEAQCFPPEVVLAAIEGGPHSASQLQLEQGARLITRMVSYYWSAVAKAYPEAWDDRHGFILWQSFGLTALSKFGGRIIQERVDEREIMPQYFDTALAAVAARMPLDIADFAGVSSQAGANQVYSMLLEANSEHGAAFTELVDSLAQTIDWGKAASAPSPLPFG